MDWAKFEIELKNLSKKVDFVPDIIIGITRGGVIPARLLCTYLSVKEMYCISVNKVGEERKVITTIDGNLVGKIILLVEDMLETGRSLIVAKKYLETKGAKVKTACLYIMSVSEIRPDYYLKESKKIENFPWESK
jgi:hypothetical protein